MRRRSESQEQLTAQEEPNYQTVSGEAPPEVEFRGERRPVEQPVERSSSIEVPFDPNLLLVHGCRQIMRLFVPVSLCMLFVVVITCSVPFYGRQDVSSLLGGEEGSSGTTAGKGALMALIFLCMVIVVTCIMVVCVYFKCYCFLKGYICVAGFLLLFLFTGFFFKALCETMEIFVDYITFAVFVWNFGVVGVLTFFWKAPLLVQQGYTVYIGAQVALILHTFCPWWTVWFLLGFLAIWDLIAVLCPKGPLRILVNLMAEQEEPLPAMLLYSTAAGIAYMADAPRSPTSTNASNETQHITVAAAAEQVAPVPAAEQSESAAVPAAEQGEPAVDQGGAAQGEAAEDDGGFRTHVPNERRADRLVAVQADPSFTASGRARSAISALNNANEEVEVQAEGISATSRNLHDIQQEVMSREDRGVKLGLGDFVFYSLMIATACEEKQWSTILATYVAILIGMCTTLLLLAIRGHALPALPISIFFGIVFYFCTSLVITPFTSALAVSQAFI